MKKGKGFKKEYSSKGQLKFEGEYLNGKRNGKGKEFKRDKLIFEGEYLDGKRNGKGKDYYYNNVIKFTGDYINGDEWEGKGYNLSNNIIYELKKGKGFKRNIVEEVN